MIEGKGLGNKKVNRVNVSLTNGYTNKLNRLSVAVNMRPTTLACLLLERCLDDQELVRNLQLEIGIHNAYKVEPVRNYKGEVVYTLNER
jgi:hypothetical protein